jgi:hypothetical protein
MAFCLETSKLFLEGLHPDPTNILIAGATAFGVTKLAALFSDMQKHTVAELHQCDVMIEVTPPGALGVTNLASEGVVPLRSLSRSGVAIFCGCLLFFAWWIATFPVFSVFLGIFMVGYGVLLWSRPHLMLAVLPAAIALLDFAPWSGRYFFDEFDLMLFISLVIGYLRTPRLWRVPNRIGYTYLHSGCLGFLAFAAYSWGFSLGNLWMRTRFPTITVLLTPLGLRKVGYGLSCFMAYLHDLRLKDERWPDCLP